MSDPTPSKIEKQQREPLIEFLEARISEEDAAARKAATGTFGVIPLGSPWAQLAKCQMQRELIRLHAPHPVKHYTARAATRRPLRYVVKGVVFQPPVRRRHRPQLAPPDGPFEVRMHCFECECGSDLYPCSTVRAVAAPYRSHPDFDASWLAGGVR